MIKVNPNYKLKSIVVGVENTPVIIIDDFALNTDELIAYACKTAEFIPDEKTLYPGIRADLPNSYRDIVIDEIADKLMDMYGVSRDKSVVKGTSSYSLLGLPASKLSSLQRIPHFDTNEMGVFALLHYLNTGAFGGTGFFRHKPTEFERISIYRIQNYMRSVERFMAEEGIPAMRYINSSTNHYELIEEIDYVPNRLVVYPGNLLHSGLVTEENDVGTDPKTGRLTANIFVNFE